MHRLVAILLLCGSITTGYSQVLMAMLFGDKLNSEKLEFGMTLGNSFSTMTNIDGSQWRLGGFNFGLFFNVKLSEKSKFWYLHIGMIPKTTQGVKNMPAYMTGYASYDTVISNFGFVVRRNAGYIHLPVLARFQTGKGVFIQAGPNISMRSKSKDEFTTSECGSRKECDQKNELTYTRNLKDDLRRFDIGVMAGIGWKYKKKFEVAVNYNRGFLDVDKAIAGKNNNQFVSLNFNVIVGAKNKGKKSDPKSEKPPVEIGESGVKISTPGTEIKVGDPDGEENKPEK